MTVLYIEPPGGNEVALGFDVASDMARREALARAVRTGQPTATGRVRLIREHGQQAGIVIFLPVYQSTPDDPTASVVRGFVAGNLTAG